MNLGSNITGVSGKLEVRPTLELALALNPDTQRVVLISSTSGFGKSLSALAQRELAPFQNKLELLVAGGLVLLLVALQGVLSQYVEHPAGHREPASTAQKSIAFSPLAFPNIMTPYGTAALILLLRRAAKTTPSSESFW